MGNHVIISAGDFSSQQNCLVISPANIRILEEGALTEAVAVMPFTDAYSLSMVYPLVLALLGTSRCLTLWI